MKKTFHLKYQLLGILNPCISIQNDGYLDKFLVSFGTQLTLTKTENLICLLFQKKYFSKVES